MRVRNESIPRKVLTTLYLRGTLACITSSAFTYDDARQEAEIAIWEAQCAGKEVRQYHIHARVHDKIREITPGFKERAQLFIPSGDHTPTYINELEDDDPAKLLEYKEQIARLLSVPPVPRELASLLLEGVSMKAAATSLGISVAYASQMLYAVCYFLEHPEMEAYDFKVTRTSRVTQRARNGRERKAKV